MIIQLKQGFVDRRPKRPVYLRAGIITSALPRDTMERLVKAGHAELIGERPTRRSRIAAVEAKKPAKKPKKDG